MGQRFFLRTLPMVRLSDRDRTSRTDDSAGTADASVFQGIAGCRPTACPAFERIGSIGPRLSETAWLLKIADLELWMGDPMWEQLKRTDIELAKQKLEAFRSMTLSRHAEELKDLDAQRDDIETLERLAEAVASRYLNAESSSTQPSTPSEEQPTPTVVTNANEPTASKALQDAPPPGLQVQQHVSPNFGIPLRRFVVR